MNQVIIHRIDRLAKIKRLSDLVKSVLQEELLKIPHRTYLWVYLVFEHLRNESFKKTRVGAQEAVMKTPKSVYEAYEKILSRSKRDSSLVRKMLSIILAAARPLTLSEMNIAVNADSAASITEMDLEEDSDFQSTLRSWCGLFVSVHHRRIYLLHQTAREFLLAHSSQPVAPLSELSWQHTFSLKDAHGLLANVCVHYLDLFNLPDAGLPQIIPNLEQSRDWYFPKDSIEELLEVFPEFREFYEASKDNGSEPEGTNPESHGLQSFYASKNSPPVSHITSDDESSENNSSGDSRELSQVLRDDSSDPVVDIGSSQVDIECYLDVDNEPIFSRNSCLAYDVVWARNLTSLDTLQSIGRLTSAQLTSRMVLVL